MTLEQQRIRELEKKVRRFKEENQIFKIPQGHVEIIALLMSDPLNSSH